MIVTGRNKQRLDNELTQLDSATGIVSDFSKYGDTDTLVAMIRKDLPLLNMVVNNAGQAHLYDLANSENASEKAAGKMLTNFLSVIRLNEKLLPLLKRQKEAAIINVSPVVAIVPGRIPTYPASEAALYWRSPEEALKCINPIVKGFCWLRAFLKLRGYFFLA